MKVLFGNYSMKIWVRDCFMKEREHDNTIARSHDKYMNERDAAGSGREHE